MGKARLTVFFCFSAFLLFGCASTTTRDEWSPAEQRHTPGNLSLASDFTDRVEDQSSHRKDISLDLSKATLSFNYYLADPIPSFNVSPSFVFPSLWNSWKESEDKGSDNSGIYIRTGNMFLEHSRYDQAQLAFFKALESTNVQTQALAVGGINQVLVRQDAESSYKSIKDSVIKILPYLLGLAFLALLYLPYILWVWVSGWRQVAILPLCSEDKRIALLFNMALSEELIEFEQVRHLAFVLSGSGAKSLPIPIGASTRTIQDGSFSTFVESLELSGWHKIVATMLTVRIPRFVVQVASDEAEPTPNLVVRLADRGRFSGMGGRFVGVWHEALRSGGSYPISTRIVREVMYRIVVTH